MAEYLTTDTDLTSVANAIRAKGGTSASLAFPTDFVSAIGDIPTASAPVLQAKTVVPTTSTETVTADSGYDGLSSVTIQLPVYAGEHHTPAPVGHTVTVSLTNPKNGENFSECTIFEQVSDGPGIGEHIGTIESATGSATVVIPANVYGIYVLPSGTSVLIDSSGIICTGGVSKPIVNGDEMWAEVTGDGTLTLDGVDYDD